MHWFTACKMNWNVMLFSKIAKWQIPGSITHVTDQSTHWSALKEVPAHTAEWGNEISPLLHNIHTYSIPTHPSAISPCAVRAHAICRAQIIVNFTYHAWRGPSRSAWPGYPQTRLEPAWTASGGFPPCPSGRSNKVGRCPSIHESPWHGIQLSFIMYGWVYDFSPVLDWTLPDIHMYVRCQAWYSGYRKFFVACWCFGSEQVRFGKSC